MSTPNTPSIHCSDLERKILNKLLATIFKADCTIEAWCGGDEADGKHAALTDECLSDITCSGECSLVVIDANGEQRGSIYLVMGNEEDIICDWSYPEGKSAFMDMLIPSADWIESLVEAA